MNWTGPTIQVDNNIFITNDDLNNNINTLHNEAEINKNN